MTAVVILAALILTTLGIIPVVEWQNVDCGVAETLAYPVDMERYQLVQGFSVPSPRHQGRYHTGEDYAIPGGESLAEPVRAIGRGVVTYSYTLGWGRDAGVVIVRHTLPDGVQILSQYGHISATDAVPFPLIGTCVEQGDVLGVIADVRPAPHVHLEIKLALPDAPGPGYSWVLPENDEPQWRMPSRLIDAYSN
ncbi:MAG: M23 family metallopeptidase [Chloroflexi bacterium]|nr:M23 family metallopeptidase [Chloroflexota bacterium]